MEVFTPKQIVKELDKYIIGQNEAKRAVAIALRNRYRRKQLPEELREEIMPKNILMIGPTGVGKTEIARRLAKLVGSPFIKIEATKFTEVGYVGRDVEAIVRDLVETSIRMVKGGKLEEVKTKAEKNAEDRLVELMAPMPGKRGDSNPFGMFLGMSSKEEKDDKYRENVATVKQRRKFLQEQLNRGELEDEVIEIEVEDNYNPMFDMLAGSGAEEMGINMQDMFGNMLPKKKKKRKVKVSDARHILVQEEAEKLIDSEAVTREAIEKCEQSGIVFLDEMDKIAASDGYESGPDVSREGVQRDILPIIEGTTVVTKYGPVKTDHILFIAAGAFHVARPSDLIPELQGRLPIRVELNSLSVNDFERILTEPKNALTKQYHALMATEQIILNFTEDGIKELAEIAYSINSETENIGARRLQTIMEKLLEDISFEGADIGPLKIDITKGYVKEKLNDIAEDQDLSRYIL